MKFIDTHSHLYLPEFDNDRDETVRRAIDAGVSILLLPNIDRDSIDSMNRATGHYKGICFPMSGLHPTSVKADYLDELRFLEDQFDSSKYIAIGEIGIDLYWDKTFFREQEDALIRQFAFAIENDLPVVIHSRDAFPELFSVLDKFKGSSLKGVFHAFTGSKGDADKAISMGFLLGIGGIVTFKNSGLDKVVSSVDPRHIILETDSPYLAPVPHRGKRNESCYIPLINRKLAEIYNISEEKMASITTKNAAELFKLDYDERE
jgi:TatD DNase family protein